MKCGRETISEQVFCPDCLVEMEKYPVRPGTLINLPVRKTTSVVKKTTKKRISPLEDQIRLLKKRCRILAILLLLMTVLTAFMSVTVVEHFNESRFKVGQNYSTIIPTEAN